MRAKVNLTSLHEKSRLNRPWLSGSEICGCFYCFSEFPFDQILDWVDNAETARCPVCGIDAVLGFNTQKADQKLLHRMHDRWFKGDASLTAEEWKTAIETNRWPSRVAKPSRRK